MAVADVISSCGMPAFTRRLRVLEELLTKWSQDLDVVLCPSVFSANDDRSDDEEGGTDAENSSEDSESDERQATLTQSEVLIDCNAYGDEDIEMTVDENEDAEMTQTAAEANIAISSIAGEDATAEKQQSTESEEENEDAEIHARPSKSKRVKVVHLDTGAEGVSATVKCTPKRKVRGRPKGTGKLLNRVFPRDAKKTQTVDNCVECGMNDPPVTPGRRKKRMRTVDWVQCDQCDFWYHLHCTSLVVAPTNVPFVCVRCA